VLSKHNNAVFFVVHAGSVIGYEDSLYSINQTYDQENTEFD
jgi:hypothetical protein